MVVDDIKNGKIEICDLFDYVIDPDDEINLACAESKYSPEEILDIAARNDNPKVRMAVANNPNTSEETLEYLTSDELTSISDIAFSRLAKRRK